MTKSARISRTTALLAALLLVISALAGCATASPAQTSAPAAVTASSAETAAPTTAVATATPEATPEPADPKLDKTEYYEIQIYPETYDPKADQYADQNYFRKLLKEKFNFGYKYVAAPQGPKDMLPIWLAAGDYPEMVRMYEYKYWEAYFDAGALIDIKPLAAKYAPEFVKRKGAETDFIAKNTLNIDPNQWVMWNFGFDGTYGKTIPYLEWTLRSDIIEQQGYPDIVDENSVMALIKQGLQDNPKTNGANTIGLSVPFGAWEGGGTGVAMYLANLGKYHHFTYWCQNVYDPDLHKYVDYTTTDSWKTASKFYNKMYREGLLDRECITDSWDAFNKKMETGQALGTFFFGWGYGDYNKALQGAGANFRYVPMTSELSNQIAAKETKMYAEKTTADGAGWMSVALTKNCKYPERIMEVMNYCMSEEGMVAMGWGQEGVNYTVDGSGKRVPTQAFFDNMKSNPDYQYTFMSEWSFGFDNVYDANNQCYNILQDNAVFINGIDPKIKEVWGKYGWAGAYDMYTKNKNFQSKICLTFVKPIVSKDPLSEEDYKTCEKINKTLTDYTVKLVLAKSDDDWQKLYDEMQTKRGDLGVSKYLDMYNAIYEPWYAVHASEGNYAN